MSAPVYDARSVLITVGTSLKQIFPSNANRVSIILSSDGTAAANGVLDVYQGNTANSGILRLLIPAMITMPYRDYGPIIKREFWATVSIGTVGVRAVEVFVIPQP